MMKLQPQHLFARACALLLVMAGVLMMAGPAWSAPAKKPVVADKPIPASIFNGDHWQITPGKANAYDVLTSDDQQVLKSTSRQLIITGKDVVKPQTRITLRFRLAEEKGGVLTLSAGHSNADDLKDHGVYLSVSASRGQVRWSLFDPTSTGRRPLTSGYYRPQFSVTGSLAWPESLRRNVEADEVASAPLESRWLTLEMVLHDKGYEASIDGIALARVSDDSINTTGKIRLMMLPGVELASMNVSHAQSQGDNWVYQPVSLASVLNASKIDGKTIDLKSLTSQSGSGTLTVQGVPFELATPTGSTNNVDHVDLGYSWFRQGNLSGGFSGRGRDVMAGRWSGALSRDPARIALRVPRAQYTALHLLAAADGDANSVPVVTAQFYRADAGFPKNFASRVPLFTAKASDVQAVPVKTTDGGQGRLYMVTIPIDPADLEEFADLDYFELELTKEVKLYRAYPDPTYYSLHAAGLPSSVHVYALTAQRPSVEVDFKPTMYGDIWTSPEKPGYNVTLHNRSNKPRNVKLTLTTTSLDGQHKTQQQQTIKLPADQSTKVTLPVSPDAYGYHDVELNINDGEQTWNLKRSLAYLHTDTRERGNWDFGRGAVFGFYAWNGGHNTPSTDKQLLVMAKAGIELIKGNYQEYMARDTDHKVAKIFDDYKLFTLKFANSGFIYSAARFATNLQNEGLEKARAKLLEEIEKNKSEPGPHSRPTFLTWYPEPSIGPLTSGIYPQFIGEPLHVFTPSEQARYDYFLNGFVEGAKIVKKAYPGVKTLMPHGDPAFVIPFLNRDAKKVVPLLDGITVDIPAFERLPEQQFHQVSIHKMYMTKQTLAKAGIKDFLLPMYEGPCVPSGPGALSNQDQADLSIRDSLMLQAYGVDMQTGGFPGFDTASYWGEQHYGFGVLNRLSLETPKPAYAALATMTRHLNRANFDGYVNTGSHSVFALRFKHYKTGELVYAMWTLRGKRPITLHLPQGSKAQVYDQMDNLINLKQDGSDVTFTLDQSPCYVRGLPADPKITLGQPDHSDSTPANITRKLASLGDGSWQISDKAEEDYENSHTPYIYRFPSPMTISVVSAPTAQAKDSKALSIHFPDPKNDRVFVPNYSVLTPAKPIVIPGKASHLGMWVKGSSDWGRAVYFLRDAKGEQWINVGTRGAWNCDDLHSWMSFNFDGWRYLRMELPANSPYDQFREAGSTWWGPYSRGDGNIDLPLTLEKIVIERRTHVMYVDSPVPADRTDVLLGDLYAEYDQPSDTTPEVIRESQIRMKVPSEVKGLDNPIARMTKEGTGSPIQITKITLPDQAADGTRCYVHFPEVPDAKGYEVWASDNEAGAGALQMGKVWKAPGQLVRGLRPNQDFYLYVVYIDADGKHSKPSAPFKINLEDFFGMK